MFTLAWTWIVSWFENCWKSISSSHSITFSWLLYGIIILAWSWVLSFIEHRHSFKILPTDPKRASFFWAFLKIRRFVIFIRGWTKYLRVDVTLLAKSNKGSPIAQHGWFVINGITKYYHLYFCFASLGDLGALLKLKQALAVELFRIDFEAERVLVSDFINFLLYYRNKQFINHSNIFQLLFAFCLNHKFPLLYLLLC